MANSRANSALKPTSKEGMVQVAEPTPAAQAAADLVADAARIVEAPPEGEQPVDETHEVPSFEKDTTGIEDLLRTEADEEPEVEDDPSERYAEYEDEYDPEALKAQIRKLEKQNKFLDEQRVIQGKKNWKAEAERRFPYADVGSIEATSRRQFLIAAEASHDRMAKKLKPAIAAREQQESEAQTAETAARREAEALAWGSPSSGPPQPMVETSAEAREQLDRRRHPNSLEMVRARFKNDKNLQGVMKDFVGGE